MVGGLLTRKLLRDLRHSWAQFAAAAAVVFLASTIFVAFQTTYASLLVSRDTYYARHRMADFFVHLEKAPESALRDVQAVPGVWRARGRVVQDVPLDVPGNEGAVVGRIISMPERRDGLICDIFIVSGSYFPGADLREVIVNRRFAEANGLRIGDTFRASFYERKEDLRIVGTAYSPEYVYPLRGAQQMAPDDATFALIFARETFVEDAFDMTNAFNDLVGTLRPGANVDDVLDRIETVLTTYGVYYKYGRAEQLSSNYLAQELEGVRKSAVIVPLIFLIVAAVVTHVIVRRLTDLQRTQIGLLFALGYGKAAVVLYYVSFALAIAVAGTVPGAVVGYWLAGRFLVLYNLFFRFPSLTLQWHPSAVVGAFALSCGMCAVGAVKSVWRIAHIQPAVALRPAPPVGQRVFHRGALAFIWDRLPVVWRITLRNSIRARARTVFSVLGVAVAMMMLVLSTSMNDLFDFIIEHQFYKVDRSDLVADFFIERPETAVLDVASVKGVRHAEGILQFGAELRSGWRKKTVFVLGLPHDSRLYHIYDTSGRRMRLPADGLVLPERLARKLDLRRGSAVSLDPYLRDKDEVRAVVRGVVDQYVGLTVYADRDYLARLIGEGPFVNAVMAATGQGALEETVDRLDDMPGVSAVTTPRAMMESFRESVADLMRTSALIQTIAAGIIAFAVIYNTSSVNISEQERDLACLSSLGYSRRDVADIGTDDIMPLTLVGVLVGIPLGVLSCMGIARAYETDLYKLPVVVKAITVARCAVLVLVFSLIARWSCRRRVHRIDIVRRLKTME